MKEEMPSFKGLTSSLIFFTDSPFCSQRIKDGFNTHDRKKRKKKLVKEQTILPFQLCFQPPAKKDKLFLLRQIDSSMFI